MTISPEITAKKKMGFKKVILRLCQTVIKIGNKNGYISVVPNAIDEVRVDVLIVCVRTA